MTEVEKARKRTKKNWKREIRRSYKQTMFKAELSIENSTNNFCTIYVNPNYTFATWIVKKKLESKGFKCDLYYSPAFEKDELFIDWRKDGSVK